MKRAIRLLVAALALIGMSQFAAAQMGMGMGRAPSIAGVFNPEVGSGAAYEILHKSETQKTNFEMAAVGKEGNGYWIETTMPSPHGTIYAKTLSTREGDNVMVQRTIVLMPGRPPMDMSSMMKMHGMQSEESKADMRANAENLGNETITTPAGTFACQHWRSKKDGSEYWLNDKVSPWKLVKMTSKDETITLTKIISDAKTHITGTPVSMEEMMKQRMGNMGNHEQ